MKLNKDLIVNSKIMGIHITMLVVNNLVDLSLIAIIKGDGPFANPDAFAAAEFFYFIFQNVIQLMIAYLFVHLDSPKTTIYAYRESEISESEQIMDYRDVHYYSACGQRLQPVMNK